VGNVCSGTSIEKVSSTEPFFFPNPMQNVLHLKMENEDSRLMLFDIVGNKVIDQLIPAKFMLNTSAFKAGIYFIKVENTSGIYTGKLIKK